MSENYALITAGATASATNYTNGFEPDHVIDGNDATSWVAATNNGIGKILSIQLSEPRQIEEIRFQQHTDAGYRVSEYDLDYSDDGITWTTLETHTVNGNDELFPISPRTAEYWRVVGTAGCTYTWAVYSFELWGVPAETPPVPGTIAEIIQWIYDYAFQQANDKLEELDPGWNFTPVEAMLLAGAATAVMLCQQILAAIDAGADVQAVLDAIGSYSGLTLHERHTTSQTLIGNAHSQILDTQDDLETALGVTEGNLDSAITAGFVNHETSLGTGDGTGNGKLDLVVNSIDAGAPVDLSEVLDELAAIAGKLGEYGESETVHSLLDVISTVAVAVQTIAGDLHTDLASVAGVADAILTAVGNLTFPADTDVRYPGPSGVTFGTATSFVGSVLCTAAANGVGGRMDGVIVDWASVPPTKGRQQVQGITNYKFLGWLMFLSPDGKCDEIQWLGAHSRAYTPKQLTSPGSVVISARDASAGSVKPWVLT